MTILEKEVWGQLTQDQFQEKLSNFTSKFGEPKVFSRLALQITDYNRKDLDTRIRIDNGRVRIIQKIGDWNAEAREEVELDIPIHEASEVVKLYQLLNNLIDSDHVARQVIQLKNYVFETDDSEIKLTHQSGLRDAYSFEVEVNDTNHNPVEIAEHLGLEPDLSIKDDKFWKEFGEKTNLGIDNLNAEELKEIVEQYLKQS